MELRLKSAGELVERGSLGDVRNLLPARNALFVGGFLCLLQALDGVFTSIGVSRFGTGIEGNPIIRVLMEEFGHVPVLSMIKLVAVLVVVALTFYARRLPWVNSLMGAVSCVYVLAAIIPWTYILFVQPYIA